MATSYVHTKATVNLTRFEYEIAAAAITTTFLGGQWEEPDSLTLIFDADLLGSEETAVASIVAGHSGKIVPHYRLYCSDCTEYYSFRALVPPTECPECDGSNISDVVESCPSCFTGLSPNSKLWECFLGNDGSIIIAVRK